MAYSKQTWENLPNQTTPITAERLNHMEDGIYEASTGTSIEVHNDYNTSTIDSYSCNYVNGLNTYSTDEIRVGTWINNKPIYRKVFNIGALPNATEKIYTTDLDWTTHTVIKIDGCAISSSSGVMLPINFSNPISAAQMIGCRTTGTNTITIYTGIDRTNLTGYVILEYTKTTD